MNRRKIAYYVSTGLLTVLMLFSIQMYVLTHEAAKGAFLALGYPAYLVYPLAAAKALGLAAVWLRKPVLLKNLAYAGFFYNFLLAFGAHLMKGDGQFPPALIALVLLAASYFSQPD